MIGDILLGNYSDDITLMDDCCNVIKLSAELIRKSGNDYRIKICRLVSKIVKAFYCLIKKSILKEKITACISGQSKLREYNNRTIVGCCFSGKTYCLSHIVINITDSDLRACRRHSDKTVKHGNTSQMLNIFKLYTLKLLIKKRSHKEPLSK